MRKTIKVTTPTAIAAPFRAVCLILLLLLVTGIGVSGCALYKPKAEDLFTEFYLLNQEGMASNYPQQLRVNEVAGVIVGVVNREGTQSSYRVEVWLEGERISEINFLQLADGQKWEQEIEFSANSTGTGKKVIFYLFKGEVKDAYATLHLLIDITE